MQASELIQLLKYAIEKHGDKQVCMDGPDGLIVGITADAHELFFLITGTDWVVAHRFYAGPWGPPLYYLGEELTPLSPFPP